MTIYNYVTMYAPRAFKEGHETGDWRYFEFFPIACLTRWKKIGCLIPTIPIEDNDIRSSLHVDMRAVIRVRYLQHKHQTLQEFKFRRIDCSKIQIFFQLFLFQKRFNFLFFCFLKKRIKFGSPAGNKMIEFLLIWIILNLQSTIAPILLNPYISIHPPLILISFSIFHLSMLILFYLFFNL